MKNRPSHGNDLAHAQMLHESGVHTLCYFPTHKTRSLVTGLVGYHDGRSAGWCIKAGTVEEVNV